MAYHAFISYSHAKDSTLARNLRRGLHRFARPWYRMAALRVFVDEASLSASADLKGSIERALDDAEWLLLLASPESARSEWVRKEIGLWLSRGRASRMLLLLTDGEIAWDAEGNDFDWERTSAFPPEVRNAFDAEPLWVDLRWAKSSDDCAWRNPRFRDAVADVAAPLHGRPKDEMIGEDVRQHRRRRIVGFAAVAALVVTLLFALAAWRVAEKERREAEWRQSIALAGAAVGELDSEPEVGLLLALESLRVRETPIGVGALWMALHESRIRHTLAPDPPRVPIEHVAFSADGTQLETRDAGGRARRYRLGQHEAVDLGTRALDRLASPRGGLRVTFDAPDGPAVVRQGAGGGIVSRLEPPPPPSDWVTFDAADERVLVPLPDKDAVIHDVRTGKRICRLSRHSHQVTAAAFHPEGRYVMTGCIDTEARIFDAASGALVTRFVGHRHAVLAVAFARRESDLGSHVATGSSDRTARHWAWRETPVARRGKLKERALLLHTLRGPEGPVLSVAFSPDGGYVAAGSEDGKARVWQVHESKLSRVLLRHTRKVYGTAFSPDGRHLASAGRDGTICIWDVEAATLQSVLRHPGLEEVGTEPLGPSEWAFEDCAYAPDQRLLVAVGFDGAIHAWDLETGKWLHAVPAHRGRVHDVNFSPDGRLLVTAGADRTARVWSVDEGGALLRASGEPLEHPGEVETATFSPDGRRVLTACRDRIVRLWPAAGGPATRFVGHEAQVNEAIFLQPRADGRLRIASMGDDGTTRFWDAAPGASRREIGVVQGDGGAVYAGAISPAGDRLITVSDLGIGRVWDAETGVAMLELRGHTGDVNSVTLSPDGRVLATAGDDHTVRLWRFLGLERLRALALARLGRRALTAQERRRFLGGTSAPD